MSDRRRTACDPRGCEYDLATVHHPHCATCRRRLRVVDRQPDSRPGCGLSVDDFCAWCLRPTSDAGRALEAHANTIRQKAVVIEAPIAPFRPDRKRESEIA